ncbi:MAG: invasion associated locus B family protein [Rhodobacteraceae bacterium]|jgi:invasion protein IalB|nr:invasion associated locus B family protein [Paracoccaceae bacterium]
MLKSRISLAALLIALGTALPALAQEATTPPAEGTVAPADDAAVPGTDLSMGVEVAPADLTAETAEPGQTYTAGAFEAWSQRCVKSGNGSDPCQLYMLLRDSDGNSVAELSVFNMPEGAPGPAVGGATVIAPLETLLTAGLQLIVDGNKPRAYPFTVCTQIGCVARLGFTAEEVAMLKKGNEAKITIVPFVAPDQPVELTASLKGFTAGYDAVAAANKTADAAAAKAAAEAPAEEAPKD